MSAISDRDVVVTGFLAWVELQSHAHLCEICKNQVACGELMRIIKQVTGLHTALNKEERKHLHDLLDKEKELTSGQAED